MKTRTTTRMAIATLTAAALLVSACGGDDESTVDTTMAPAETMAPADTMAPATPGDIVAVASANPDFSTLVTAVAAAGLVETLQGPGPFTVFAPTNDAFAALDPALLEKLLLPENVEVLKQILTYHVVSGTVMAADVTAGDVPSVQGEPITVTTDGGVKVNGANVIVTDVAASNGVIHAIDAVILPPSLDVSTL